MADDLPPGFRVVQPARPRLRPFQPGEQRPNADGSVSTEISTTWQLPTGEWANVPSLWMGPDGKPVQFKEDDEQGILGAMQAFEGGEPVFPRFRSVDEAIAAAEARSSAGGASAGVASDIPLGFRPVQEEPSVVGDMAASFAAGVPRGAVETAMFPVTAGRMIQDGTGWAMNKGEDLVRMVMGADPVSPETRQQRADLEAQMPSLSKLLFKGQDAVRGAMDSVLYEPKTTPGEFAQTIGEFAAPGAIPTKASRLAPNMGAKIGEYVTDLTGNVIMPALLSEGAGQLTEGSDYEGLARLAGALTGNVATAGARAYNAPESVVRRATAGMAEADWDKAKALQNNQTGVKLTGPEAIAQARDGASALPNIQRVVEGSIEGRARTGEFFAQRPGQVDTAVEDVLNAISPQSAQPSVLGPRAAEAAGKVVDKTRQGINAQTRPLYKAAEPHIIPDAEFAPIAADPRFQAAVVRLRANPELAPDYAAMPDNSIAVVDAVTKDMTARGEALANSANPLYGPELAGKSSAAAANARDIARDPAKGGSAAYDQALTEQQRLRRTVLEPVSEGPVGRVAKAGTTQSAGDAIMPQNPLTGSGPETADAVRALSVEDPETIAALIRQNLADRFGRASTETMEGGREFSGAKFHKSVAGNPQRQEVLDAVLGAIPGNNVAPSMDELLDVLQATGRRKPIGSATEFNRSINVELGDAAPIPRLFGLARTLGASFLTNAGDATKRAALRGNLSTLADMFVDPQSVEILRAAVNRGAPTVLPEALVRTAAQGGPIAYDPRERR